LVSPGDVAVEIIRLSYGLNLGSPAGSSQYFTYLVRGKEEGADIFLPARLD